MQYTNSAPSRGETRYWSFIGHGSRPANHDILVLKVKVKDIKWDYENEYDVYYCVIEEIIVDARGAYDIGDNVIVDYAWELQETLRQAQSLMLEVLFEKGVDAFFDSKAPF